MKPPTKASIGLEAIQSSLYYLHVSTAEDEEIKRSVDVQRRSDEENRPNITIARKPLPPSPLTPHPLPPLPHENDDSARYDGYDNTNFGRRSVGGTSLRVDTNTHNEVHRKPVGEPSFWQQSNLYRPSGDYEIPSSAQENQHYQQNGLREGHHYNNGMSSIESPSSHKPPLNFNTWNHETASDSVQGSNSLEALRRTKMHCPPVTIIRRDPTSGSQWNIGTIKQLEPTFSGSNLHPVAVELQTPGYGRFNRHPETPRPGSAGSDVASIRRAMESATMSPLSATSEHGFASFERIVDYRRMKMSDIKKSVYQHAENVSDMKSPKGNLERNVLAFTSPWQGTCTFVNGIDGRSFKIKHTISSTSSTGEGVTANVAELRFNLSWSLLGSRHPRKENNAEPDTLPIPKLIESKRQNFRKSFQHFKDKSRDGFHRGKVHVYSKSDAGMAEEETLRDISNMPNSTSNNFGRPYPMIQTPSYSSSIQSDYEESDNNHQRPPRGEEDHEDEERLSLRLGRERAGGGFGGHSAKLGKLIIEDEGLKMCDLVVGAAMGIWWQHYEGK